MIAKTAFWVDLIQLEAANIDDLQLVEPDTRVKSHEKVIGELPSELKRIFTMIKMIITSGDELCEKINTTDTKIGARKIKELRKRADELSSKAAILFQVFLAAVYDEFKLWGQENIMVGVRTGWRVVVKQTKAKRIQFKMIL